jgi:hypothetical protein
MPFGQEPLNVQIRGEDPRTPIAATRISAFDSHPGNFLLELASLPPEEGHSG